MEGQCWRRCWRHRRVRQTASALQPLGDREFWELTTTVSEPGGNSGIENLVSNEVGYLQVQRLVSRAREPAPRGGAYLGVGPEQNFTYIANLRPDIAFIVDIRRANRDLHLLYRALFELAQDRVEFVSLLFSLPRPGGLVASINRGADLRRVRQGARNWSRTSAQISGRVTAWLRARSWPLSDDEWRGIETVYEQFFQFGPRIAHDSMHGGSPINMAALLKLRPTGYSVADGGHRCAWRAAELLVDRGAVPGGESLAAAESRDSHRRRLRRAEGAARGGRLAARPRRRPCRRFIFRTSRTICA